VTLLVVGFGDHGGDRAASEAGANRSG
jgi:hypothetical protein